MKPHVPRIRIITPASTEQRPFAETVLTTIYIDEAEWYVTDYRIDGNGVDRVQTVTLTFHADVTVEHQR